MGLPSRGWIFGVGFKIGQMRDLSAFSGTAEGDSNTYISSGRFGESMGHLDPSGGNRINDDASFFHGQWFDWSSGDDAAVA